MTAELRSALGLQPEDPPPWLYKMRILGYPPGYRYATMPIMFSGCTSRCCLDSCARRPRFCSCKARQKYIHIKYNALASWRVLPFSQSPIICAHSKLAQFDLAPPPWAIERLGHWPITVHVILSIICVALIIESDKSLPDLTGPVLAQKQLLSQGN